jgi:DNA mismatch repair protein MutS
MVELASYLPRVKNFNVAVREEGGEVIFLYKIVPGGVDRSYGIHVAQLAGLPRSVLHRAREVLEDLEGDSRTPKPGARKRRREAVQQMSFLAPKSPLSEELEKLDLDAMTPLEALNKLYEMKKRAGE